MANERVDTVIVTTAGMSGSEDRRLRQRRYFITQVVRISCFVLSVVLPIPLWARLILIVGAFVLPMMGVVAANAGPTIQRYQAMSTVEPTKTPTRIVLEPGRTIDQD